MLGERTIRGEGPFLLFRPLRRKSLRVSLSLFRSRRRSLGKSSPTPISPPLFSLSQRRSVGHKHSTEKEEEEEAPKAFLALPSFLPLQNAPKRSGMTCRKSWRKKRGEKKKEEEEGKLLFLLSLLPVCVCMQSVFYWGPFVSWRTPLVPSSLPPSRSTEIAESCCRHAMHHDRQPPPAAAATASPLPDD